MSKLIKTVAVIAGVLAVSVVTFGAGSAIGGAILGTLGVSSAPLGTRSAGGRRPVRL